MWRLLATIVVATALVVVLEAEEDSFKAFQYTRDVFNQLTNECSVKKECAHPRLGEVDRKECIFRCISPFCFKTSFGQRLDFDEVTKAPRFKACVLQELSLDTGNNGPEKVSGSKGSIPDPEKHFRGKRRQRSRD